MIFQAHWFDVFSLAAAWTLLALLLCGFVRPGFASLKRHHSAATVAAVILAGAWSLTASPDDGQLAGMNYHLLFVNLTALMLGAPAALWLGALLLFPYLMLWGDWQAYPANALVLLLPSLGVHCLARFAVNRLPANLFIFIFINGFIASAAAMLLTGLILVAVLDIVGAFSDDVLWSTAFPVFFLISWAEAFLSGITTAIFVALRPNWLNTFDDNRYLKPTRSIW